ncbi:MAG: hypothetical protein QXO70_03285 [Candidatus Pacearchaeota archaeon]
MKKQILLFVIFLIHTSVLLTQTREPLFFIGGFFNYSFNEQNADFGLLPQGSDTLPSSDYAKGYGFSYGGMFEVKLSDMLNLSTNLGFVKYNATYSNEKNIGEQDIKNKSRKL